MRGIITFYAIRSGRYLAAASCPLLELAPKAKRKPNMPKPSIKRAVYSFAPKAPHQFIKSAREDKSIS